ncbi:unnamed protein product [Phaeothamnion confervicola]
MVFIVAVLNCAVVLSMGAILSSCVGGRLEGRLQQEWRLRKEEMTAAAAADAASGHDAAGGIPRAASKSESVKRLERCEEDEESSGDEFTPWADGDGDANGSGRREQVVLSGEVKDTVDLSDHE